MRRWYSMFAAAAAMALSCGATEQLPYSPGQSGKGEQQLELTYSETDSFRTSCEQEPEGNRVLAVVEELDVPEHGRHGLLAILARIRGNCADQYRLMPSVVPGTITLTVLNVSDDTRDCDCDHVATIRICGLRAGTYRLELRPDSDEKPNMTAQPIASTEVTVPEDLPCPAGLTNSFPIG